MIHLATINYIKIRTVSRCAILCLWLLSCYTAATAQSFPVIALKGDYPDPSIARDGRDYYMTHSPFYYAPGFLIWHSQDLVNWEPIARAAPEYKGTAMAPDLLKYKGRFYIYFPSAGTNWVIWANNIRGPWSKPIDLKIKGIDPGHVVGEDGKRYLYVDKGEVIRLADDGLATIGEKKKVYDGWEYPANWVTECKCLEAPKLRFKGGYYYLTSAEGGTAGPATSHMAVVARSKSVMGPWENSPYNPLVHTYSDNDDWWSKGHGTLIDDVNGNWWVVYHAYANGFHTLGRQTLIEPIEWTADGWPKTKSTATPIIPKKKIPNGMPLSDNFNGPGLGLHWTFWKENATTAVTVKNRVLHLPAKGKNPADARLLLATATDKNYETQVTVNTDKNNAAGLMLFYNENAYAGIVSEGKNFTVYKNAQEKVDLPNKWGNRFLLKIQNKGNLCSFLASSDGKNWTTLADKIDVSGMNHNQFHGFFALRIALLSAGAGQAQFKDFRYKNADAGELDKDTYKVESPDHQTKIQFGLNSTGQVVYQMNFKGHSVTDWSALGLETNGPELAKGITIGSQEKNNHKETFDWALGENARIDNNYQQLILHCQSANAKFDVIARVFNGSLAIRYAVRDLKQPLRLKKELTEFNLTGNYKIYQYHEESVFRPTILNDMPGICDFPATLVSDNKLYLTIGEAENRNDTKSVLIKGHKPNSLALDFYTDTTYRAGRVLAIHKDSVITFKDSLVTPWRTISCAETAIGLHNYSQLNLKLVSPLTRENPTNIKPGKVFRVPISTQGGIDGADFAAKMNFQYILLDAGWYGAEFRTNSDPTKPIPELDLAKIIANAKAKGIGVILYVNYVGLRAKLDTILPLYKKWGVSGMKFGFVDGGTQNGLTWLDSAMQKVNDYGFILNVHDHYKPTGLSRRYPYNLSQEGIRGDENSPDAFHTMTLPYTRYLAGPADFTFCYPNPLNTFSKNLKVSKGQQLALTVVYFDPLQAIFWYGKSQDYHVDSPDIEFFKYVPTVWDESRYLQGEIGESVSVARRKGNDWYIGAATGFTPWVTNIKLDFLNKKKNYTATIYSDDEKGGISIKKIKVKNGDIIPVSLAAKGGQAIILRPVE